MLIYNATHPNIISGWYKTLTQKVAHLASVGFEGLLLPPITQTASGDKGQSLGYDKRYDLNIGQFLGDAHRGGTASDLATLIKECNRCGMIVLEDNVVHQYGGAAGQTYYEKNEFGKIDKTLLPKGPRCFVNKTHAVDNVFDPEGNEAYGDMVTYEHCHPPGYMFSVVSQASVWRKNRVGLGGQRIDDGKGEAINTIKKLNRYVPGWNFTEVFVGSISELIEYIKGTETAVLDFPFHWAVTHICNEGRRLDSIVGASLWEFAPDWSVPFVDTNDTDKKDNQNVRFNKLWAYVLMMTVPCKGSLPYAGDYDVYKLNPYIDNLAYIHKTLAFGKFTWEFRDATMLAWSRDGDGGKYGNSGGLLCAFTNLSYTRSEWVRTPFPPNTQIHDFTGHGKDLWTNADGWVYLTIGPNVNGDARNYVCYGRADHNLKIKPKAIPYKGNEKFFDFNDIVSKYK